MTRCPNCGSAIRIGAKFCTSCGFRLPIEEPVVSQSRSPFATTSSTAWSATTTSVEENVEDTVVVDAPATNGDASSTPTWLADEPAVDGTPTVDEVVSVSPSGEAEVIEASTTYSPESVDSTDDSTTDSTVDDQPEPSWFMVDEPDQIEAMTDDATEPRQTTPDERPPSPPTDETPSLDVLQGETTPALPTEAGATTVSVAPTPAVAGIARTGDPLAEARSLVAQLQDVLTRVPRAGAAPPSGGISIPDVADEAEVEALRGIVASAQERPRDVDVMLDLVLRADTIAAVLDDRATLLAALRGDEQAVEDAWPTDDRSSAYDADAEPPATYPAWGAS